MNTPIVSSLTSQLDSDDAAKAFYECAVEGFFRSTESGKFIHANPALVHMLGLETREQLFAIDIGRDLYRDPERRRVFIEKMRASGRVSGFEYQIMTPNGARLTVAVTAREERNAQGELQYYEGCIQNVTQRCFNEDYLMQLLDNTPFGYHEIDSECKILSMNQTELDMLGVTRTEILNDRYIYQFLNDDAFTVKERVKRKFALPVSDSTFISPYLRTFKGCDGQLIPAVCRECPSCDEGGRIVRMRTTVAPIDTARILDTMCHGIGFDMKSVSASKSMFAFCKDINGNFTFSNQLFNDELAPILKLRGFSSVIGHNDFDFFPEELAVEYCRDDKKILEGVELVIRKVDERHHPLGGTPRIVNVVKLPLKDLSNETVGIQGIFWDASLVHRVVDELVRELAVRSGKTNEERRRRDFAEKLAEVGSWEWEVGTESMVASQNLYDLFGDKSGQIKFEQIVGLVDPEYRDRWDTLYTGVTSHHNGFGPFVFPINAPHLGRRWLTASCAQLAPVIVPGDTEKSAPKMVGTVQDVTKLKESELKLNALHEKECRHLREWAHRATNYLVNIDNELDRASRAKGNAQVLPILQDLRSRLLVIQSIQDLLYKGDVSIPVDLGGFFSTLTNSILQIYSHGKIRADVELQILDDVAFHFEIAKRLGMIVSECISNSFKYAFNRKSPKRTKSSPSPTNVISICFARDSSDVVSLTVSDNGIGFNPGQTETEGLKLIRQLATEELGATYELNAIPGGGTIHTVRGIIDNPTDYYE